jgi:hypothetical protein
MERSLQIQRHGRDLPTPGNLSVNSLPFPLSHALLAPIPGEDAPRQRFGQRIGSWNDCNHVSQSPVSERPPLLLSSSCSESVGFRTRFRICWKCKASCVVIGEVVCGPGPSQQSMCCWGRYPFGHVVHVHMASATQPPKRVDVHVGRHMHATFQSFGELLGRFSSLTPAS